MEATDITKQSNVSESEVYENALRAIRASQKLVIAEKSARDVDRLLTFLQIAKDTGKQLAILPKDAYLLKIMHLLDAEVPDPATHRNPVVYQDTIASRSPHLWLRNIYQECGSRVVLAKDVHSYQGQFILCFSFFDLNELPSIRPTPGSLYVYSSSEPHDEEQGIDFRRLHNWLRHFEFSTFGLPIESNGQWSITEEHGGLHASGHACGADLIQMVRQIEPKVLISIHCESPGIYIQALRGSKIDVVLLRNGGGTVEI